MSTTFYFYVWLSRQVYSIVYPNLLQPTTCIRNPNLNATLLALPRSNRTSCHPGVCVPVAFFACQVTKFALCYPNLAFSEEGVDAILSWRLINPRKLQRVKCKVALSGWLAYRVPVSGQ